MDRAEADLYYGLQLLLRLLLREEQLCCAEKRNGGRRIQRPIVKSVPNDLLKARSLLPVAGGLLLLSLGRELLACKTLYQPLIIL